MSTNFNFLIKYIVIGDSSVGKSNLILQFSKKKFNFSHDVTIGVEFEATNIEIENKVFRLQIWDTAGQETFKSITRNYYKNTAVALVVYDVTSKESYYNIQSWIEECENHAPKNLLICIIGNKTDMTEERVVQREDVEKYSIEKGFLYFECSAKTGIGVFDIFYESAKRISSNIESNCYNLNAEGSGVKIGMNSGYISTNTTKLVNGYKKNKKCC